jgi:hypothetical protein
MASPLAIALRRQAAIDRIVQVLDVDFAVQGNNAALNEAIVLERIADAVETLAKKQAARAKREARPDDK